jgi:hypothetical protein
MVDWWAVPMAALKAAYLAVKMVETKAGTSAVL